MTTFPHQILPHAGYLQLQTLQSLARTCRDFHEHALNALWHTIPSLALLVYTLPQDAWEPVERTVESREDPTHPVLHVQMTLRRQLVADDLLRWKHYAHRIVRILAFESEWFPERTRFHELSPSLMGALVSFFPNPPLLSNLSIYHTFHVDGLALYRTLPVLFGPKLQIFYHCCVDAPSELDSEENDFTRMLVKLREQSPSLLFLGLSAEPCSPQFARNAIRELYHYRELVSLLLDDVPVTVPDILHFSTALRRLQKFHATLSSDLTEDAFDHIVSPSPPFSTLRHFHLEHECLAICTAVVRLIRSKLLSGAEVSVKCDSSPPQTTVAHVRDYLAALADAPFQPALMRVLLQVDALADPPESAPLTNDTLAGLLRLTPKVVGVEIDVHHPLAIDDTLVTALAYAYPDLRYLALGTTRSWKGPAPASDGAPMMPTLRALVALADHCPRLHTLGLAFDPRTADLETETRPGDGAFQDALRALHVGRSPIAAPEAVAAFLSDIFLQLPLISCGWASAADLAGSEAADMDEEGRAGLEREVRCSEAWAKVDELQVVFMEIRDRERDWAERALASEGSSSEDEEDEGMMGVSWWTSESEMSSEMSDLEYTECRVN
ncbi:hypothetical protein V8D89_011372 [Ganoderma adspersum]